MSRWYYKLAKLTIEKKRKGDKIWWTWGKTAKTFVQKGKGGIP